MAAFAAGSYFWARAQKHGFNGAFTRHNAGHYTLILGSAFLAFHFAQSWVSPVTKDFEQLQYLERNKAEIITGRLPFDRSAIEAAPSQE